MKTNFSFKKFVILNYTKSIASGSFRSYTTPVVDPLETSNFFCHKKYEINGNGIIPPT